MLKNRRPSIRDSRSALADEFLHYGLRVTVAEETICVGRDIAESSHTKCAIQGGGHAVIQLKEFVQSTLVEIVEGVRAAQVEAEKIGANINPTQLENVTAMHGKNWNVAQTVEFDVAVSASDEGSSKGGIGVFVAGVGLGVQHKTAELTSALSRIRFSVPILLSPGRDARF